MTPVIVPRVARLNSQSPASLGERNGSSSAIWKIAAVAVLALSWRAAETALRRNRNRRKCTTKRSVSSMPAVEQTAKTLRPSVAQTPEIAPALAPTELSGPFTTTAEERIEIPEGAEEVTPPAVVTSAEPEVAPVEEVQPEAYHKAEPDGELSPLIEPVFESSVEPAVEQTAETLRPSVPHTPEIAPALAAVPIPPEAARITEPSDEKIRLRAYFISEHRCRFALPGDEDSDWRDAKRQLLSESGELSGLSTITTEAPSEIPARTEEIALPAVVTPAETEVGSRDGGEPMAYETTFTAIQSPAAEAITESASDCPNATSPEPVFPQTTAPATMPETTQMPTAPVNKPPATAVAKPQTSGMMQISVQLTFSFEIAAMQLTPTFKMGVLQVRPISKIVTMRMAPSQQPQPEVSFEIAKIQPVGETLGTIRVIPSQQQRPIMGSRSIAGLQLVPSVEATPIQLTPSQQGQAAVFVTVPCQISTIEFSPLFEIASVVLDSSSKQVLVQLAGAGPSPADGPRVFEIADLQLSEGGDAGMIQLNLLDQSSTET